MSEFEQLQQAIALLEAQRSVLGDSVVDAAQAPLKEKLSSYQGQTVAEQRKLVTVLFSDLVGFTSIAEQIDPEDVREILQAYFTRCTACIEGFGGVVEKYIGDAIMAVFGLRVSHENESERAIRAALEMQSALAELNETFEKEYGLRLSMRIGIHTGQVVVSLLGDRKGDDFVVVGDTVNIASRLQSLAPPNSIVTSFDTFRLVRGVFNVKELGPVDIKGRKEPIQAYLVLREKERALRLDRSAAGPIIGRDSELTFLEAKLQQVIDRGEMHTLTILGETGLGKTRLVEEFENRMELHPNLLRYFKGRASFYLQNQPYSLLRDLFSFRFGLQESDVAPVIRKKLEDGFGNEVWAHFIGQLLGFYFSDSPHLQGVQHNPQQLRDQALSYLAQYFRILAAKTPVVVVAEDVHWADTSSLSIYSMLARELASQPFFVLITARPEFLVRQPQWGSGVVNHSRLELQPLTDEHSLELAKSILPGFQDLPEQLSSIVTGSARGNPFFIQELLRMLVDEGGIVQEAGIWSVNSERLAELRVPPTLAQFLQSRLDSLDPGERALLQRASVVGTVFWDQAVEFLSRKSLEPTPSQPTHMLLDHLHNQEIILRRDASSFEGMQEYLFEHNLFRDVTYESLLKRQRRHYHHHIASWLEQVTKDSRRIDEYAILIAGHYAMAEETDQAYRWYRRAGELAAGRFANDEAIYSYSKALEILPEEEIRERFSLLLARETVFDRMGERNLQQRDIEELEAIAEKLDPAHQSQALLRRSALAFIVSDRQRAMDAAQKAAVLMQDSEDDHLLIEIHLQLGKIYIWQSDHVRAVDHLERGLLLSRQAGLPVLEAECLWNLAIEATNSSDYARAYQLLQDAAGLYHRLGNKEGEAITVSQTGIVFLTQGKYDQAQDYLEKGLELFRSVGHRLREAILTQALGVSAFETGRYESALQLHSEALRIYREVDDQIGIAAELLNIGNIAAEVGQYEMARKHYDQALQMTQAIEDRSTEVQVWYALSQHHLQLDEITAALEKGRHAVQLVEELEMPYLEGLAIAFLADALGRAGYLDQATEMYRRALKIQQEHDLEKDMIFSQAGLLRVTLRSGDLESAYRLAEEIVPILEKEDPKAYTSPLVVYLSCYEALQSYNDTRAKDIILKAHALLHHRSTGISDAELRHSYLERVPLNRELHSAYLALKA